MTVVVSGMILISPPHSRRDAASEFDWDVIVYAVAALTYIAHHRGMHYIVQLPKKSKMLDIPHVGYAIQSTRGKAAKTRYTVHYELRMVKVVLLTNVRDELLEHLQGGDIKSATIRPSEDASGDAQTPAHPYSLWD
eukprot:3557402-Pyramimonas_sp.AAC.1